MPVLFMALAALAVFLIMGAMVFYAAYSESHLPPPVTGAAQGPVESQAPAAAVPSSPAVLPAPSPARAMSKAAGRG